MIAMSPIVEKRKRSNVGGRRVNGLQTVGNIWLAGASSAGSAGYSLVNRSLGIGGGSPTMCSYRRILRRRCAYIDIFFRTSIVTVAVRHTGFESLNREYQCKEGRRE